MLTVILSLDVLRSQKYIATVKMYWIVIKGMYKQTLSTKNSIILSYNAARTPSDGQHDICDHTLKKCENLSRINNVSVLLLLGQIPAVSYIHALASVVIRHAGPLIE